LIKFCGQTTHLLCQSCKSNLAKVGKGATNNSVTSKNNGFNFFIVGLLEIEKEKKEKEKEKEKEKASHNG
jgi:hypothetical protein